MKCNAILKYNLLAITAKSTLDIDFIPNFHIVASLINMYLVTKKVFLFYITLWKSIYLSVCLSVCLSVPFARSETHLSELLDGVCDSMSDYALYFDPDTHHKQYRRFAPRISGSSEDFPDFKNFKFDGPEASNNLKFACETLVEELEDDIISLLGRDEGEDVQKKLCSRVSGNSSQIQYSHLMTFF
uniref:DUF3456 domain-containing protein n=1 Tax=Poecilia mexicana TaxID=48701 RepID=A0A3B3Z0I6_9TELE